MKVIAKNDEVKRVLYHPTAGAFREDGTAEWPEDTYTARRLADGDITTAEVATAEKEPGKKKTDAKHDEK